MIELIFVLFYIFILGFFIWVHRGWIKSYNKLIDELVEERQSASKWRTIAKLHGYEEESIDDKIEKWHLGDGEGLELHEYLGMTWEEYKDWLAKKIKKDD